VLGLVCGLSSMCVWVLGLVCGLSHLPSLESPSSPLSTSIRACLDFYICLGIAVGVGVGLHACVYVRVRGCGCDRGCGFVGGLKGTGAGCL